MFRARCYQEKMKSLTRIALRADPHSGAFVVRLFQLFMVVTLCFSGELLADDITQNSGVISKQQLFLEYPNFEQSFNRYEVREVAGKIPTDVRVLIFFGTWCHDSQREVPRMLKILEAAGLPEDHIKMVTLDFSKTDPGGLAVANGVEFTPTFIVFRQQGEIGRIIEKPATTLEEAMVELLSK